MKAQTSPRNQKILIFLFLLCLVLTPILSVLFFAITGGLEQTIQDAAAK